MEISVHQLMGLSVYSLEQGEKVGQVRNFLPNTKEMEIVALLVADGKFRKEERVLCLADVTGLSLEAVTVDSPAVLRKKTECAHLKELLRSVPEIEGLSVLKKDGTFLGRAASVAMDSETGKISRIELSRGGFLPPLGKSRAYLNAADIEIIGSDVILAKDNAMVREETPHHGGGVKARVKQHLPKGEPGCGERIMAMSGKSPLPRRRKTVFPEIPREEE